MSGTPMVPYVVKDGEHLDLIAHRLKLDAQTIWNDPKNADLRKLRSSPNVLGSGDILYVPNATPSPQWLPLETGQSNAFKARMPVVNVSVQMKDQGKPLANAPCTVRELPALQGLSTDGQGMLKLSVPLLQQVLTICTPSGRTQTIHVGDLDPISTPSGLAQRLKNLGHHVQVAHPHASHASTDLSHAIALFQKEQSLPVSGKLDAATSDALVKRHGA
jgi:hypothetical protein